MTEPTPSVPFGDTPHARCVFYRRVCDLPARIDPPELGRITVASGHLAALVLPSALAHAVHTDLQHCYRRDAVPALGPVLSHPRSGRWTFLIRPDFPDDTALFTELFRLHISLTHPGTTLALPSPTDRDTHFRRWIHLPHNPFRPAAHTVLDSIRACTARTGWLRTSTLGPRP
ncbi:DNA-directed RNA polymerase subunit beta [Nocardia flavorosea]|uniref:DNA-directed RNA polymerase subunit beta n=1 Tax=Nocardia flavorosea TaxID=53429 RepID=UPI001895D9B8|nr:DNA-directed RNA polymerase subunit beta [Nocardia flavorosea]MBF6351956.1 DNA-directed RNA polymerase subunit beta [Nocardia flavorosea]